VDIVIFNVFSNFSCPLADTAEKGGVAPGMDLTDGVVNFFFVSWLLGWDNGLNGIVVRYQGEDIL